MVAVPQVVKLDRGQFSRFEQRLEVRSREMRFAELAASLSVGTPGYLQDNFSPCVPVLDPEEATHVLARAAEWLCSTRSRGMLLTIETSRPGWNSFDAGSTHGGIRGKQSAPACLEWCIGDHSLTEERQDKRPEGGGR
jgi:hypothetical protein